MLKILIVEDDPMVRMLTVKFINSLNGFEVVKDFGSSGEALSYLEKHRVDLFILDMFLPDRSGLQFLKDLRERELKCDVIFVTASNSSDDIKQAFQLGAVDYLIKPFDFDRLKEALDRYLGNIEKIALKEELTQTEIDHFYLKRGKRKPNNIKGIQESTLTKILNIVRERSGYSWSVREVSEETGISIVTVKKYLDHLVELGRIRSHLCYKSVGRPQYLYEFVI